MEPPTGILAQFEDDSLQTGFIKLRDRLMACVFNWSDGAKTVSFQLPKPSAITLVILSNPKRWWNSERKLVVAYHAKVGVVPEIYAYTPSQGVGRVPEPQ